MFQRNLAVGILVAMLAVFAWLLLDRSRIDVPIHPVAITASRQPLPADDVRHVAVDVDGSTWFRVAQGFGLPDKVAVLRSGGEVEWYADLETVVRLEQSSILRHGSLTDFWAVDGRDNIWVGAAYFDGVEWHRLAEESAPASGSLRYEDRAIVDAQDRVWVPYRLEGECGGLAGCASYGLSALDLRGSVHDSIQVEVPRELEARNLPWVQLTQAQGEAIAVASDVVHVLGTGELRPLDAFAPDLETGQRGSGFATASALRADGGLVVFARSEADSSGMIELGWTGQEWLGESLVASPLVSERYGTFVTSAAYDRAGTLWLASSQSELAARLDRSWTEHFYPANSPLGPSLQDMALGDDGSIWLATKEGVRVLSLDEERKWTWKTSNQLYIPALERSDRP